MTCFSMSTIWRDARSPRTRRARGVCSKTTLPSASTIFFTTLGGELSPAWAARDNSPGVLPGRALPPAPVRAGGPPRLAPRLGRPHPTRRLARELDPGALAEPEREQPLRELVAPQPAGD